MSCYVMTDGGVSGASRSVSRHIEPLLCFISQYKDHRVLLALAHERTWSKKWLKISSGPLHEWFGGLTAFLVDSGHRTTINFEPYYHINITKSRHDFVHMKIYYKH